MSIDTMPRGPLSTGKSGTLDYPDKYSTSIQRWRESAREEARRMHKLNAEVNKVALYIKAIQGDHWDARRPQYRSRFVDNRIAKARYDDLAMLTDSRPIVDVSTPVKAFEPIGDVIGKTIRYEWTHSDLDLKLVTAADICKAYGTAFWKIGAARPGITMVTPCGPDQVMPIQPGFDIQESTAVLYKTWKTVQFLKSKFPLKAAGLERESLNSFSMQQESSDLPYGRPDHIEEFVWHGLSPAMKRVIGIKGGTPHVAPGQSFFNSVEVEEFYVEDPSTNDSTQEVIVCDPYLPLNAHSWWYRVKPGGRLYPRKRHLVFGGARDLSDGPSIFWHGLYPYSTLRLNPVFYSFWGLSKYRDLLPLNQAMNEIVAGALDLIKRALNPTALTKEGAIPPTAWKEFLPDIPGQKLRTSPNASLADSLRYMDAPNIPPYVFQMLQSWLAPEFDRMSGAIDIAGLGKKKQVPGGDTLDQMKDSQQTGLRLEGRMTEIFLRDACVQAVSNILQFYTAPQRLRILGGDGLVEQDFNMDLGTMLPEGEQQNPEFFKHFVVNLVPGSLHGGAKDRSKQLAFLMAKSKMISLHEMYRKMDMDKDYDKIIKEMKEEAEAMGASAPQGKTPRISRGARTGNPMAV